jgi:hypothetical protein
MSIPGWLTELLSPHDRRTSAFRGLPVLVTERRNVAPVRPWRASPQELLGEQREAAAHTALVVRVSRVACRAKCKQRPRTRTSALVSATASAVTTAMATTRSSVGRRPRRKGGPGRAVQNSLPTRAESVDADGSDPGAWTPRGRPRQRARCRRRDRQSSQIAAHKSTRRTRGIP